MRKHCIGNLLLELFCCISDMKQSCCTQGDTGSHTPARFLLASRAVLPNGTSFWNQSHLFFGYLK